jgi:hypothetical protein
MKNSFARNVPRRLKGRIIAKLFRRFGPFMLKASAHKPIHESAGIGPLLLQFA